MDNEKFQSELQGESKRPYHKPVVQVYGTLRDMTQAQSAPSAHAQDNPSPIQSPDALSQNRT